jgi:hypothetical protein
MGPRVKRGYRSSTFFQHQSVLTTILDAMGTAPDPGTATTAVPFNVF